MKNNKHYNIDEVTLTVKDYTPVETKARLIHEATQTETELTFEKKDDFTVKATAALPQENGNVIEGQYKIVWEAADAFENKAEKTITFTVDRTVPALSIKANGAPLTDGQYFKDNTTITVQVDDDNYNKDKTTLVVKRDGKAVQVPALDKNGRLEFTLKENGRYEITLNAEDEAGNKAEPIKVSFTIDKDLPELSITGVDNNGYYPEAEVHVKATDFTLKQARLVYEFNGETEEIPLTWQSAREAVATALFGKKACSQQPGDSGQAYFCEEGRYTLVLTASDHAGNGQAAMTRWFTIDYTKPEISLSGIADGAYEQSGTLDINVEDNLKLNKITVEVNGKEVESVTFDEAITSWSHALSFNKEEGRIDDGHYHVKVTAIDEAGHKRTKEVSFVIDSIKPEITIDGVKNNTYYDRGQTISIMIEEANFKPENVMIKAVKKGSDEEIVFGQNWHQTAPGKWAITKDFNADGEYTITVNATDDAGNKATTKKVTFTIDSVDPIITVQGVANGKNYKSATAVIMVTDTNIDLEQTELIVTKGGEPYDVGSLKLIDGSVSTAMLTYDFTEEGPYTIRLKTTDKAGRTTELDENISFIIDSTAPVVTIEGAEEGSYNPDNVLITISVTEHNFRTNTVTFDVTRNGEAYPDFPAHNWKNTGKTSQLIYAFTEDGDYTVTVTAIDKAGNGPVTSTLNFTVDQTAPAISINGADNGGHYNTDKTVNDDHQGYKP